MSDIEDEIKNNLNKFGNTIVNVIKTLVKIFLGCVIIYILIQRLPEHGGDGDHDLFFNLIIIIFIYLMFLMLERYGSEPYNSIIEGGDEYEFSEVTWGMVFWSILSGLGVYSIIYIVQNYRGKEMPLYWPILVGLLTTLIMIYIILNADKRLTKQCNNRSDYEEDVTDCRSWWSRYSTSKPGGGMGWFQLIIVPIIALIIKIAFYPKTNIRENPIKLGIIVFILSVPYRIWLALLYGIVSTVLGYDKDTTKTTDTVLYSEKDPNPIKDIKMNDRYYIMYLILLILVFVTIIIQLTSDVEFKYENFVGIIPIEKLQGTTGYYFYYICNIILVLFVTNNFKSDLDKISDSSSIYKCTWFDNEPTNEQIYTNKDGECVYPDKNTYEPPICNKKEILGCEMSDKPLLGCMVNTKQEEIYKYMLSEVKEQINHDGNKIKIYKEGDKYVLAPKDGNTIKLTDECRSSIEKWFDEHNANYFDDDGGNVEAAEAEAVAAVAAVQAGGVAASAAGVAAAASVAAPVAAPTVEEGEGAEGEEGGEELP